MRAAGAQISGARVKLSDAPRGVSERRLRLSGQPQQVQAAVNLVQARAGLPLTYAGLGTLSVNVPGSA